MSTLATTRSARGRRRRILVRRTVAATAVLALVLTAVGIAFAGSQSVLPPGAAVAGVDVGGMSVDDAVAELERRSEERRHTPVRFVAGSEDMLLSASQIGVRADWRAAVEEAATEAGGFGPLRGWRRLQLRLGGGVDVAPRVEWYGSAVAYSLEQLSRGVDRRSRPARVRRLADGRFTIDAGRNGRALDRPRAAAALVGALAALDPPRRVELPVRTRRPTVDAAALRTALRDARAAVSAPVRLVHRSMAFTIRPREMAALLRLPAGGGRKVAIGGRVAERWFERLSAMISRAPRSASWEITPSGGVRLTPAVARLIVDVPRTVEAVERAAFTRVRRTVPIAVRTEAPERSTEEAAAMGIREVVASYTTVYGGTPGRVHNVGLVAELVDGALIPPGGTFSFNGVTGERNASRGFQEAPVIINGELQTGIGGGVCQVSTTVFNAAFEAGLPIGDRTNHALYIAHYPIGRDATVNYPDVDLRFVNDTSAWMQVRTFVGAGALTVKLLGRSPGRRVETETAPLEVVGKTPFRVVRDETLPRGTRIREQLGTHPRRTSVRRRVYDAGGALLSDAVWASYYVGEPTVVRIGTGEPEAPRPEAGLDGPQAPAPIATGADSVGSTGVTAPAATPTPTPRR